MNEKEALNSLITQSLHAIKSMSILANKDTTSKEQKMLLTISTNAVLLTLSYIFPYIKEHRSDLKHITESFEEYLNKHAPNWRNIVCFCTEIKGDHIH
jgi:hypothetical protein